LENTLERTVKRIERINNILWIAVIVEAIILVLLL
jgi:hypothetical protein